MVLTMSIIIKFVKNIFGIRLDWKIRINRNLFEKSEFEFEKARKEISIGLPGEH
jgi:hypothetical protein